MDPAGNTPPFNSPDNQNQEERRSSDGMQSPIPDATHSTPSTSANKPSPLTTDLTDSNNQAQTCQTTTPSTWSQPSDSANYPQKRQCIAILRYGKKRGSQCNNPTKRSYNVCGNHLTKAVKDAKQQRKQKRAYAQGQRIWNPNETPEAGPSNATHTSHDLDYSYDEEPACGEESTGSEHPQASPVKPVSDQSQATPVSNASQAPPAPQVEITQVQQPINTVGVSQTQHQDATSSEHSQPSIMSTLFDNLLFSGSFLGRGLPLTIIPSHADNDTAQTYSQSLPVPSNVPIPSNSVPHAPSISAIHHGVAHKYTGPQRGMFQPTNGTSALPIQYNEYQVMPTINSQQLTAFSQLPELIPDPVNLFGLHHPTFTAPYFPVPPAPSFPTFSPPIHAPIWSHDATSGSYLAGAVTLASENAQNTSADWGMSYPADLLDSFIDPAYQSNTAEEHESSLQPIFLPTSDQSPPLLSGPSTLCFAQSTWSSAEDIGSEGLGVDSSFNHLKRYRDNEELDFQRKTTNPKKKRF